MIFASDLDHTLIFPLRTLPDGREGDITLVEWLDGQPLSYMPTDALTLLSALAAEHRFIPVTSRSRRQLGRVAPILELAGSGPVICANGAVILTDGAPDPGWRAHLTAALTSAATLAEAGAELEAALGAPAEDHWLMRTYGCDDAYWYGICDVTRMPADAVTVTVAALEPLNWTAVLHGRKLYALPRAVSKEAALRYVVDELGRPGPLVCAGDSVLDAGMLALADIPLAPADSPAAREAGFSGLRLVPGSPLAATVSIVQTALAAAVGERTGGPDRPDRAAETLEGHTR